LLLHFNLTVAIVIVIAIARSAIAARSGHVLSHVLRELGARLETGTW
jgi:hypothetical protein